MKKHYAALNTGFILCFLFLFCLLSCKGEKQTYSQPAQFVFDMLLYNNFKENAGRYITADLHPEHLFYPENANNFFLRHTFSVHSKVPLYLFEFYNPEYTGILDSINSYCESCDSASWVEYYVDLFYSELAQDNLSQVLSELDNTDSYTMTAPYSVKNSSDKIPDVEMESQEKRWLDSQNRLKIHSIPNEIFIPENKPESKILISASKQTVTRSFYDDKYRLIRKENWNITDAFNYSLLKTDLYDYSENKIIPDKKETVTPEKKIICRYNDNGLVRRSDVYGLYTPASGTISGTASGKMTGTTISTTNGTTADSGSAAKKEENKSEDTKEYFLSKTLWFYDEKNRLTIEEFTEYTYEKDKYDAPVSRMIKRQDYIYNKDEEIPADYKYYENGILKMKTEYESKDKYVSKVFFEGGFEAAAFYEDGKHVKDVYSYNGVVRREQKYEQ